MAERGRKDSRLRDGKDKSDVLTVVRDHRTNDSVLGHVGRVTYISPDDGASSQHGGVNGRSSIGTLATSRETGKPHYWRQVRPFEQWHSPLTSDVPGANMESSVLPRQYMAWLLKSAPEALEGIAGPPYDDVIEDIREAEMLKKPQTRLPLLAYGEIADTRGSIPKGCQVLAMATGESGHALRIVRVTAQDWTWTVRGNISLPLDNIDTQYEGYWCGNAMAINQVKFAVDNPAKPMSRWLVAQKSAETLIFEPTLGRVPVLDDPTTCADIGNQGLPFIAMDLKIRIPMSKTGGRMHCDMAFNTATGTHPPQLAIVDDGGNWSVWNIIGDRRIRKTTLSTVLHAQGNLAQGRDPSPYSITPPGLGHLNRIAWLPAAADEQSRILLLGNAAAVNIVDLAHKETPMLTLNTVHTGSLDVIVDIQISPRNPAHIFVLTTVALFWFDLSSTQSTRRTGKSSKKAQPLLLLSCPHLHSPTDRTIKLCLVPAGSGLGAQQAITALIYSIKQPETVVFRLPDVTRGQEPSYEREVMRFHYAHDDYYTNYDNVTTKGKYNGQQTIIVLSRVPCVNAAGKVATENFGQAYIDNGVDFFQVIALRPDLSLQWSLYSCSPSHADGHVATPFPKKKLAKRDPRRKQERKKDEMINYFADRFVVPDGFTDEMVSEEPAWARALPEPQPVPEALDRSRTPLAASDAEASETWRAPKRIEVYNMARLFNMLNGRLEAASVDCFEVTDAPRDAESASPLDMMRRIIGIANEYGSFAYTTLYVSWTAMATTDYLKEYGADLTSLFWPQRLPELGTLEERRVSIFDEMQGDRVGQEPGNAGLATLYEVMGRLCAISLARDDRERFSDDPFVRRQGLLAYMAVNLYFSQISMVIMPRQTADSASAWTTPAPDDAQSTRTQATSLSAAELRQQREQRHYRDTVLSSSPTKPSVPNWLMSSSQEYDVQMPASSEPASHVVKAGAEGDGDYVLPSTEVDDLQDIGTPGNGTETGDGLELDDEDPVVSRLRQFAKSIRSAPPLPEGELRLIKHWELGTSPDDFNWVPLGATGEAEEELRRQAQEAREKRQRRLDKRAQRDRERLLSLGMGAGASGGHAASSQPMSSQLPIKLPSHFQAQASPAIMSSQVFSSQVIPQSQPVIHSGATSRPKLKKKKKKPTTARGFK